MVALDSCVVIDLIDKGGVAGRLRASLRGKSVRLVLCGTVLGEVKKVRGWTRSYVMSRVSELVGKRVEVLLDGDGQRDAAASITEQYRFCHEGDNRIVALCRARDMVLLTFDRALLKACECVGVAAFHPTRAGGI